MSDIRPDFRVTNHGSLFLLRPITDEAEKWVAENIADDTPIFGDAVAIEHRYVYNIVNALQEEGFEVQ